MVTPLLYVLEFLFLVAVLAGVALIYVPAAFILGGLLGVVAVERVLTSRPAPARRKEATQ